MAITPVLQIIDKVAAGEMVIIVDDEDRENEGDLLIAASKVTPQAINFMTKYGRGLICLTLPKERCDFFSLPLMVPSTSEERRTNFTISIEAKSGVTTGISAHDRAHTVRVAVDPQSSQDDLVVPGHIFPLMAQPGGVLTRAGHTEAGCDLARLANLYPAAVIVEILNDDGSMARRDDLEYLAKTHSLSIGLLEDLIRYRTENEQTVIHLKSFQVQNIHGDFILHAYEDLVSRTIHFALVKGKISREHPVLVRVHVENPIVDNFFLKTGKNRWPLENVFSRICEEGHGIVVFLRQPHPEKKVREQLGKFDESFFVLEPHLEGGRRTLGVGGQILRHLGVGSMRLMSSPQKLYGLGGYELNVQEFVFEDIEQ